MKYEDYEEIVINEIFKDEDLNDLYDEIFSQDIGIDIKSFINFLKNKYLSFKANYSDEIQIKIENYIKKIECNEEMLDLLLIKIKVKIIIDNHFCEIDLLKLDLETFWIFYSLAIKQCTVPITTHLPDKKEYFKMVSTDTNEKKMAHSICYETYESEVYGISRKSSPMLRLFLHSFHSKNKKMKTKKKNIHRVIKRTKKIMQIIKITERSRSYNTFQGKSYVVVDDFADIVIKYVLKI